MSFDAVNDLLMGGGTKAVNWQDNPIGYTIVGTIVDQPKVEQMKKFQSDELDFWPSGDPKMQIVVTLQTDVRTDEDDDGRRRLHIPPRMQKVVAAAIRTTGAKGLAIGGRLAVQRTGGTGKQGSPFEHAAEYAPPAVDPGSLLNQQQPAAAPVAPAPAPVAPMLTGHTATPPPAAVAPVSTGGLLAATPAPPAELPCPPTVDPTLWAALPVEQKQAVAAAFAAQAGVASQPGF